MATTYPIPDDLAAKRAEGVIEPSRLLPGTIIYIETVAQVFEFTVGEGGKLWASGAGKRPFFKQSVDFVGSITQDGMLYAGLMVYDLHLIFKIASGRYTTGCVISGSVRGNGYSYEMWERIPVREPLQPDTGDGDALAGV